LSNGIPPNVEAAKEALELSAEIVADIELARVPLANAALKASRLARLLNDFDSHQVFQYEVSGYPSEPGGILPDVWQIALLAGRVSTTRDSDTKEETDKAYLESIERLESTVGGIIGTSMLLCFT
jgi:hypothetical protein